MEKQKAFIRAFDTINMVVCTSSCGPAHRHSVTIDGLCFIKNDKSPSKSVLNIRQITGYEK